MASERGLGKGLGKGLGALLGDAALQSQEMCIRDRYYDVWPAILAQRP